MSGIRRNLQDVLHDEERLEKVIDDRHIAILLSIYYRRGDVAHKLVVRWQADLGVFLVDAELDSIWEWLAKQRLSAVDFT